MERLKFGCVRLHGGRRRMLLYGTVLFEPAGPSAGKPANAGKKIPGKLF